MDRASEKLRETVESLSEIEAAKALNYIRSLRETPEPDAPLLGDPAVHMPGAPYAPLPPVEPVHGSGIPASELLVRDRR
jgi:hypothetical protein